MNRPLSVHETEKECRKEAAKRNLTFKKHTGCKVNGKPVYKYVGRKTGRTYREMLQLGSAFEVACSDELDNYAE